MSIWMAKAAATTVSVLALGGLGAGIANAAPAADAAPAAHPHHHPGEHVEFSKNTKKDGVVKIDLQRGVVTAVNGSSVTVKSKDGYTQTYTLTPQTHVRKDKQKSDDSAVAVGDRIGIAALADHSPLDARWVRDHGPAAAQSAPSSQPTPAAPITPAPSGS
ncbi:DUF5666 domain-containing protein [Actinomycetospora endophytica]|uniref:DUF5666 domain-containing protein n=1 Tax=Actinomycetospora endophytica TaxID=2291215 RepID=A0ABS8P0V8_9PSEU|nr:DUF5666 domain-containing protein [Actinomycetospora endophytica]MCD2191881.1 DUF5666 domain-containing protein [Actinomycetospora endophytica]